MLAIIEFLVSSISGADPGGTNVCSFNLCRLPFGALRLPSFERGLWRRREVLTVCCGAAPFDGELNIAAMIKVYVKELP